jgi:hypothetical protein
MLAAQIIYIAIWLAVDPVEKTYTDDSSRTFYWCAVRAGGSSLWSALLLAWDASLLLYGVWLCISIRSFHGVWNESKQLGIVSYNTALIAGVGLVAVYALVKDENQFNILLGVAILLVVFLLQGVLFFYKYWQVRQINEGQCGEFEPLAAVSVHLVQQRAEASACLTSPDSTLSWSQCTHKRAAMRTETRRGASEDSRLTIVGVAPFR